MKKRIGILLLLSTLCLLSGCSPAYKSLEMEYEPFKRPSQSTNEASSDTTTVSAPEIDNETPYQELITKEIDIHDFAQKYCSRIGYLGSGHLDDIVADIGIECLRKTEEGALYSIHKVKQGGLLYIFYIERETLLNAAVIRTIYVQKKLSSEDFTSIKEGSTITDIKKIDPTAQIWENLYKANQEYWDALRLCSTVHYLSDGILEVGFEKQDGKLKVYKTVLTENFDMEENGSIVKYHNGKILDKDWIK